jgi:hypothetical protein
MLSCHMIAQHLLTGGAEKRSPAYTADVGVCLCVLLQLTCTCQEGMLQVFECLPLSLLHLHMGHGCLADSGDFPTLHYEKAVSLNLC